MNNLKCCCVLTLFLTTVLPSCRRDPGSFDNHFLGESFAEFQNSEHAQISNPPGVPFTGDVHCYTSKSFVDKDLPDHCKGKAAEGLFDNAHFTFVNDKLVKIESVGAGGIVGDTHQNWNWNLYLDRLRKQYGKPTTSTVNDVVWNKGRYEVHAFLVVHPMMFNESKIVQDEHVEATTTPK